MGAHDELLDDDRLTAFGLLMEVTGALSRHVTVQIGRHDLAPSEFEVLIRLSRSPHESLRMSDLAAQAMLSSSGLTRLVDRLEDRGLVARAPCPTDQRGALASVTADGHALLAGALPGHLDLIQDLFIHAVSPADLDAFVAILRRLRDHVRPGAEAGVEACPEVPDAPALR